MGNGFSHEELKGYAGGKRAEFEKILAEIVEIPTVSVEPERKGEVRRGAEYAASLLKSWGATVEVFDTKGHPIVHGKFDKGPGLPTVTVYNHLDVQPAEGDDWKTAPFRFTRRGDSYFGRGTTDDKGPAMTALFGARYAREQGVPVNIHFLWEFEEEIGSPHFESTIRAHAKDLATDSIVVSDTVWVSRGPARLPRGPPGPPGIPVHSADGRDRPALRHGRRRGAQPRHRACPADRRLRGRQDRPRQDPRVLFERRRADPARACGSQELRIHGQGLQEGSPLPVAPRQRRPRGHETDLDDADLRGARHRRGLPGPGRQDDHPAQGDGDRVVSPRAEDGSEEDREARHGVREVEESGRESVVASTPSRPTRARPRARMPTRSAPR